MTNTVLTAAGISAIQVAGEHGPQINVTGFRLGSSTITGILDNGVNMSDVQDFVYQGNANQIQYNVYDEDTVVFHVILDDTVGDFTIGNLGLFLENGTMFSITNLVTPVQKYKTQTGRAGNIKAYDLQFMISSIATISNFTVIIKNEAAIPEVQLSTSLLPAAIAPFPVYGVREDTTRGNTPSLVYKRTNQWWRLFTSLDGILNMFGKRITNVSDPTEALDAVNLQTLNSSLNALGLGNLINTAVNTAMQKLHPIGSIWINHVSNVNPAITLGFGTWQQFASGRMLVGVGQHTDTNLENRTITANTTGGTYSHTLTITEIPKHGHPVRYAPSNTSNTETQGGLALNNSGNQSNYSPHTGTPAEAAGQQVGGTGGDQPHNNVSPWIAVHYFVRVA